MCVCVRVCVCVCNNGECPKPCNVNYLKRLYII